MYSPLLHFHEEYPSATGMSNNLENKNLEEKSRKKKSRKEKI